MPTAYLFVRKQAKKAINKEKVPAKIAGTFAFTWAINDSCLKLQIFRKSSCKNTRIFQKNPLIFT